MVQRAVNGPEDALRRAAEAISGAEAMVIGAGAGMGVDSGLPDFRGREGFWRAYPPFAKLGLSFAEVANPRWFRHDPGLAWGFYGHRLNLYRDTEPHEGFGILRRWAERMPRGAFVYTSNVDGHFQKAGFDPDRVVECHGAIDWLQCIDDCGSGIFPAAEVRIDVDEKTFLARPPLPTCPACGALARPNILMFGDRDWNSGRSDEQTGRLREWLQSLDGLPIVVVECGSGTAIPTVRFICEEVAARYESPLVRINPGDPEVPAGQISLPMGAFEALELIDERL